MNPARSRPIFLLFCIICSHTQFCKAWANTNRTLWQYFIFVLHMWKWQCKLWEHSASQHQQTFQMVCTPLPPWRIMAFLLFLRQRGTRFSLLSFITGTTGTEGYYLPASGTKAASQIWISSELSLLTNRLWNHHLVSWQSQPCLHPGTPEQLLPSRCHWPQGHISHCHPVHFRALIHLGHGLSLHRAGTVRGLSLPRVQWAQLNSGAPGSFSIPAPSHLQGALAKKFFRNTPPVLNILVPWWHLAPFAPASKFLQY